MFLAVACCVDGSDEAWWIWWSGGAPAAVDFIDFSCTVARKLNFSFQRFFCEGAGAASSNPKLPVRMVRVNVVSKAWPAALHPSQTVFLPLLWSHLTGAKTPDSTAANDSAFPSLFSSSLYPSCLFTSPPSPTPQLHSTAPLSSLWFTQTLFFFFFTRSVWKMCFFFIKSFSFLFSF